MILSKLFTHFRDYFVLLYYLFYIFSLLTSIFIKIKKGREPNHRYYIYYSICRIEYYINVCNELIHFFSCIFQAHMQLHMFSKTPEKCKDCGLTFKNKIRLRCHIYVTHKRNDITKKCLICGKECKNQVRFSEN
jgi:hypothetical protein